MSEPTLAQRLAAFVFEAPVPQDVRDDVRTRVLDIIGLSLAALPLETSKAVIDHVRAQGGAPQARAIGIPEAVPAASAAFVGGVLAHSLDYDDTHLPSILHPSASVVPAVLAAGQLAGASGANVTEAIATGLEVCVRLGMAGYDADAGNSLFFERGQHATSICGAVASAAASARVLGLDADGIAHSIGLAVSMGSGVLEGNRAGGTVKRLHCGLAAQAGVNAAMLAARGFTGPPTSLEGRFGFFQAWVGGFIDWTAFDGLGEQWEVPGIFYKPYPANHFTHAAIDAAIALREQGIEPEAIEAITLAVATPTVRTIGEPIEVKRAPETGYQAQFSGPFAVAAALLGNGSGLGLGLSDFTDERARDPKVRALMARVSVEGHPACDEIYPLHFPALLTVRMRDGSVHEHAVTENRGSPERPLTGDELERKFLDNAGRVLDEEAARAITAAVWFFDDLPSLDAIFAPMRGPEEG